MIIRAASPTQRQHPWLALVGLMAGAFVLRAIVLWWTRPEFAGWFNHAPWYWVQTRGLLNDGVLPFPDLPLLFQGYALLAGGLGLLGVSQDTAIINAQRFAMCLVPALMIWPCWDVLRSIHGPRTLGWPGWTLVVVGAFLPLTFAHLPELLQKNMLGLLLLTALMACSYRALTRAGWIVGALLCFALIALTHLGTLAVSLLWLTALGLAMILTRSANLRLTLLSAGLLLLATVLGAWMLRAFDPTALDRVIDTLISGWQRSPFGMLTGPGDLGTRIGHAVIAMVPLIALSLLLLATRTLRASLPEGDRVFWLANLLLAALLVLPIYDFEVWPRLILYLPLPLLFLLGLHLAHGRRPRVMRALAAVAGLGALVLIAGETANLFRPVPDKAAVQAELAALNRKYAFTEHDLVIAPYAVAPVANWFLGTDASLVTAVNRADFERYERVFVLNSGWELGNAPDGPAEIRSDADRYRAMRRAVPLPEETEADPNFGEFAFYRVTGPPTHWRFDTSGRWAGTTP